MTLDYDAIGTALAARFAAAALTAPTGYSPIRASVIDPPAAVTVTPFVLSVPGEGSYETGNGSRHGDMDWDVTLYFDQTSDLERSVKGLRKWLNVFVYQLQTTVQLGGIVTRCTVDRWRLGIFPYAGVDYTGIRLTVRIETDESWLATA